MLSSSAKVTAESALDDYSNSSNLEGDAWGEQQGAEFDEASPPSHLANAITARWFAADLSNCTAAAAVHDEVGCRRAIPVSIGASTALPVYSLGASLPLPSLVPRGLQVPTNAVALW